MTGWRSVKKAISTWALISKQGYAICPECHNRYISIKPMKDYPGSAVIQCKVCGFTWVHTGEV